MKQDEDGADEQDAEIISLEDRRPTSAAKSVGDQVLEALAANARTSDRVLSELAAAKADRQDFAARLETQRILFMGEAALKMLAQMTRAESAARDANRAAERAEAASAAAHRAAREACEVARSREVQPPAQQSSGFLRGFLTGLGIGAAAGVAVWLVVRRRDEPESASYVDQRPYYDFRTFATSNTYIPERVIERYETVRVQQVSRELQPIVQPVETRVETEIVEVPKERIIERQAVINHHHHPTVVRHVVEKHTKTIVQPRRKPATKSRAKPKAIRVMPDPGLDAALARAEKHGRR